jgi:hypothetical protein
MRISVIVSVIFVVACAARAAPAHPLFPEIDTYYVGEVFRFGNRVSNYNEVCHDFNGDDIGDLFFLKPYDEDDPTVHATILYGLGDGTFQPMCDIGVCCHTFSQTYYEGLKPLILDVDGDGLDDLLLTAGGSASWYICHNTGTDTWTSQFMLNPHMEFIMGITMDVPLAACDCNEDGHEDFAAGSASYNEEYTQPTMVLQYIPANDFHFPTYTYTTGGFVVWTDAAFGDFNGDEIADLMERSYYSGVRIHAGEGNCQFHYFDGVGTVLSGYAHIGNFNGDMYDDFVNTHEMMCDYTSYYARVMFGGSTALQTGPTISLHNASHFMPLVVADLNGDGCDDVGVLGAPESGMFPVYLHYSEGETFGAASDTLHLPTVFSEYSIWHQLYSWDFNDDNRDDLCYLCAPDTFAVLLNAGPVAVALRSFTVQFDKTRGVVLDWEVSNDLHGETFMIRRKTERTTYSGIGLKEATPGVTRYVFTDEGILSLFGEAVTYRLDLIEQDGAIRKLAEKRLTIPCPALALHQNFPNPFNPATAILFDLPGRQRVSLEIFDVSGKLVRRLLHDEERGPGSCTVSWDGRNAAGKIACSGIYYYRLTAGKSSVTRKMALLR